MALTEKDLVAIQAAAKAGTAEALAEHDAAIAADLTTAVCEAGDNSGLVRDIIAVLRAEGVVPEIDHEIIGNDGPYYWTRGSVKHLPPGRRFLSKRSVQSAAPPRSYFAQILQPWPTGDGISFVCAAYGVAPTDSLVWTVSFGEFDYIAHGRLTDHTCIVVYQGGPGGVITLHVNGELLGSIGYGAP
jgi:hypothetical protein